MWPGLGVSGQWWPTVAWGRAKGEREITKREQRDREKSKREREKDVGDSVERMGESGDSWDRKIIK